LGQQGWALAVLTGCQDVELTQRQLGMLLCLGDKQTSRLVAKLKNAFFAETSKRGRQVIVRLQFGTNLVDFPELAEQFHLAEAERERVKKEKYLLKRNGPSLAEKMANREIWMYSEKKMDELQKRGLLSPEAREFIESARTSMRVRKEIIQGYERQLGNLNRLLQDDAKKASSASEKPVDVPEAVLTPEDDGAARKVLLDRLMGSSSSGTSLAA
jgi:hypothetical protein